MAFITSDCPSFVTLQRQAFFLHECPQVREGAKQLVVYPWILVGPGVVMAVTIFALNFLGDGLRDALDPQTRKV